MGAKSSFHNITNSSNSETRVSVVYIMGSGRSGSTLLDIILGNHPEVVSVGELINLVKSGWINLEYCSCGKTGDECSFWGKVRSEWLKNTEINNVSDYLELQHIFERYRFRNLFRLIREMGSHSSQFEAYAKQTLGLYKAIETISEKRVVVDSSKNPIRALALTQISGIDLHLIHLVRDGRGVAWSLKKSYQKNSKTGVAKEIPSRPVWRTALLWVIVNLLSIWVKHKIPMSKTIQMRYEDMILDPSNTLKRLENIIKRDYTSVRNAIENNVELPIGHIIAGNRMRMNRKVHLRLDDEWKNNLTISDRRLFWIIAGWLLKIFHYNTKFK